MLHRRGEPNHLGFVLGSLGESAELGETHNQQKAIEDGRRSSKSKMLVDGVGRQSREVFLGKLDHALVVASEVVRLPEVRGGRDTKSQVPEAPGDLQRAGPCRKRLVQLTEH